MLGDGACGLQHEDSDWRPGRLDMCVEGEVPTFQTRKWVNDGPLPIFVNKVLLECSRSSACLLPMAAFSYNDRVE